MSPPAEGSFASSSPQRLIFIDALRVAIVAFVIVHHAAQAYGPTGGYWPVHDKAQSDWFAPFYTVNSAFGLGILFLLAGYFVPGSYERKGAGHFLTARWVRLGLPLASWMLLVQLPAIYLLGGRPPLAELLHSLYDRGWQPLYAHLWFVAHLLLYSTLYVAWRRALERSSKLSSRPPPNNTAVASFVLVLALVTFLVRLRYPVDKWVPLLWIMPAEPAHLPQYLALFVAGIAAYRGDWFRKMPTRRGIGWLAIGLMIVAGVYIAHLGDPLSHFMAPGGLSLSSLGRCAWEALLAASLSIGLTVASRELFERPSRLLEGMAAASFGAYILHPPIVLALQTAMLGLSLPAFGKFVVVSVLAIALAFVLAQLANRVPFIRTMLGGSSHPPASLLSHA